MRIVNELLKRGVISREQLDAAWERKQANRISLYDALLKLRVVDEDCLLSTMSQVHGIKMIDLENEKVELDVLKVIPEKLIRAHIVLPIRFEGEGILIVAMHNPSDVIVRDDLREVTNCEIRPILASQSQIHRKIEKYFQRETLQSAVSKVEESDEINGNLDDASLPSYMEISDSPVVSLVNNIISNAVKEDVSDIHIEPLEDAIELRYRIDGELRVKMKVPKRVQKFLACRIKIMSHLDISECRRPQDGRMQVRVLDRSVDLRISTMPTVFGEKIVLRILDTNEAQVEIKNLGMELNELAIFDRLIRQPQGMILVTGPTGAGKTSTLYAALNSLKDKSKNIMTIEDPVEYVMEGVNQVQVNDKIGMTFSLGLRSMLRQDPDIILVGEVRDTETAEIALRASLTGHLVLSTLHTTGSIPTISRLKDIGIEPFLIASSLLGIIAQRLVRLNCKHCKAEYQPVEGIIKKFNKFLKISPEAVFYKGQGCEHCDFTGYKGRTAVFEILPLNAEIRRKINAEASEEELLICAKEQGFKPLIEEGISKALKGLTTLEEIEAIIGNNEDVAKESLPAAKPRIIPEEDISPRDMTVKSTPKSRIKKDVAVSDN